MGKIEENINKNIEKLLSLDKSILFCSYYPVIYNYNYYNPTHWQFDILPEHIVKKFNTILNFSIEDGLMSEKTAEEISKDKYLLQEIINQIKKCNISKYVPKSSFCPSITMHRNHILFTEIYEVLYKKFPGVFDGDRTIQKTIMFIG